MESTADALAHRHHPRPARGRRRGDHRPLPRRAVGAAADAPPGAERGGLRQPGRHRLLRPAARPHDGRGGGRRDVLHPVQAAPQRHLHRRGLHQHPVRGARRRRDLPDPRGAPRRRPRRDHGGRRRHARAHRVQRRLRLRAGRHGQLGVLRQPDARHRARAHRPAPCRRGGHPDPRRDERLRLPADVPGARRVPGRARERGRRGGPGHAARHAAGQGARLGGARRPSEAPGPRGAARHGRPARPRDGQRREHRARGHDELARRACRLAWVRPRRHDGGQAPGGRDERHRRQRHRDGAAPARPPGGRPPGRHPRERPRRRHGRRPSQGRELTMTTLTPVLSRSWDADQAWTLAAYERDGGYEGLKAALAMAPADLITMVKDSGLRGRGGEGFPTGLKWSFLPKPDGGPRYLVVNADESEPGTCKDVPLMLASPQVLIEGVIITSFAIGCNKAFIYMRGEVLHVYRRLLAAVEEARAAGYLGTDILGSGFDLDIVVHAGAGAYICGEETALLDSLEGRRGQPRLKPPFPATNGLYDAPTVVNNVGTLASVPYIVLGGADWYKALGPEGSPGTSIYSLSGRVKNPGQYEAPMGTTLRELLDLAGGMSRGKELKFWTPGGASCPLLTTEHLDLPLDFDTVVKAGSMNGTSAVQIFDEDDCVVRATKKWSEFYEHESCGKCTPCREGNYWTAQILERIWHGDGTPADLDTLLDVCDNILGRSFCALGDGAVSPIASSIKYFRDEYLALMKQPST